MTQEAMRGSYTDAMANYLTIQCPETELEGYQYRMLAVNRIQGLLPCSLRRIDGEAYLYYDITSRQCMARRYERRAMPGEEVRKVLYALAEITQSLSRYLLDDTCLLLDPEVIFYDYESDGYCFAYYPKQRDPQSLKELLEYLAGKVDPEAAESTVVLYRLCDLAVNTGFVLREELLDQEYESAAVQQDAAGTGDSSAEEEMLDPKKDPDLRTHPYGNSGSRFGDVDDPFDREEESGVDGKGGRERKRRGKRMEQKEKKERQKKGRTPGKILILAVVFLVLSGALLAAALLVPLEGEDLLAVRAGIVAGLGMAAVTAVYGTVFVYRKNRREEREEQEKEEEERRNAMVPSGDVVV